MRGYRPCRTGPNSLGSKARERFRCRRENGRYVVPSQYVIACPARLIRQISTAACTLERTYGKQDESLAIDGKSCATPSRARSSNHINERHRSSTRVATPKKSRCCPKEVMKKSSAPTKSDAIPLLDPRYPSKTIRRCPLNPARTGCLLVEKLMRTTTSPSKEQPQLMEESSCI